ncbi:flagellar biosynthetic protein FliO [Natranaerofaba carboxydovora]|uniref:flagellar biosynthetic protein FliO n=1 Tax=Natranaerofaba carboxydovora TaxID=2742683 RepID=UPI001F13D7D7|nr:flagellar biosynthetic protein FliO [Natranaerofaba carboxydovora]UMZ73373.1 Flagellar biosynthesis protein, FliO [Natranaerofaba carboxydovora]
MKNLIMVTSIALADAPDITNGKGEFSSNTDQFLNFIFYMIMFAFVIGLLFLVLKLLKRQAGFFTKGNYFTLIDSIMLSKETSIHLVELGGKIMVIGTGKEVSILTILDDPEIINEITKERIREGRENQVTKNFKGKLLERLPILNNLAFLKNKENNIETENVELEDDESSDFERELKEQLKKLKQLDKDGRGGNKDEE